MKEQLNKKAIVCAVASALSEKRKKHSTFDEEWNNVEAIYDSGQSLASAIDTSEAIKAAIYVKNNFGLVIPIHKPLNSLCS